MSKACFADKNDFIFMATQTEMKVNSTSFWFYYYYFKTQAGLTRVACCC